MLTKDIIAQPLGTEFVIAHPNAYVHKSERKPETISENKSLVVTLHSKNTYAESNHTWSDASHPTFVPSTTDKVKYFLVKYSNGTQDVFRTIKAQDFIGTKGQIEQAWVVARAVAETKRIQKEKEDAVHASLQAQADSTTESLKIAVKENAIAMFGNVVGETVGSAWVSANVRLTTQPDGSVKGRIETSGEVRIPVEAFLQLAERWSDLQNA